MCVYKRKKKKRMMTIKWTLVHCVLTTCLLTHQPTAVILTGSPWTPEGLCIDFSGCVNLYVEKNYNLLFTNL